MQPASSASSHDDPLKPPAFYPAPDEGRHTCGDGPEAVLRAKPTAEPQVVKYETLTVST
jgi:hypothetical protein